MIYSTKKNVYLNEQPIFISINQVSLTDFVNHTTLNTFKKCQIFLWVALQILVLAPVYDTTGWNKLQIYPVMDQLEESISSTWCRNRLKSLFLFTSQVCLLNLKPSLASPRRSVTAEGSGKFWKENLPHVLTVCDHPASLFFLRWNNTQGVTELHC